MPSNGAITQTLLNEIGWDNGQRLPIANAENKKLEDYVVETAKRLSELNNELAENTDRFNAVSDHLKNVRQELQNAQALHAARKKEIESEQHLKRIQLLEKGRLKRENLRMEKELEALKDRKNAHENNIYRQRQRMDAMKQQMQWDQKALETWLEECGTKDDDSMMIQKYARQDETKIKEMTVKMSQLADDLHKKRRVLENEVTETNLAQMCLDKMAEQFRRAHSERQELISQWEATIEQMQRRDLDMDLLAAQLMKKKQEVRVKEAQCKEKEQFFDSVLQSNHEYDEQIKHTERTAAKVRADFQDSEKLLNQFTSDMDVLRRTVDRTSADLEAARSEVTQIKKEIGDKENKLIDIKNLNAELEIKYKKTVESKMSADERSLLMEKCLNQEEKNQIAMSSELAALRDLSFKKAQQSHDLAEKLKTLDNEIQGTRATIRNYVSRLYKMEDISLRQQEMIYNQDFTLQMLERRMTHMTGERMDDTQIAMEGKIKELKSDLDKKYNIRSILSAQLKHLQDEVRNVKRELEKSTEKKQIMTVKIEELSLHNDNAARALKKQTNLKQDRMVEDNILKLEIKRLRDTLYQKADSVLSQEKHKLKLETAMREREQEIQIHVDMLRAQMKSAEAEKAQISLELHERISKIDKLRKRYEILTFSMTPPEGEKEQSQAYFVIKAAQEKEELQREGDELDAKVRKAEKELRALGNTMRLMATRNEMYKKSFSKVPECGEEALEMNEAEEQLRALTDKHKYKKRQIRELQEDLNVMANTVNALHRDATDSKETMNDKENKMQQLRKELQDQQEKLERANKINVKYSKQIRAAKKTKEETVEERDIEVRELREMSNQALKHIGEVVFQNPNLSPIVQDYFAKADIPAPPVPGTVGTGSRASQSTLSSARSTTIRGGSIASSKSSSARSSATSVGGGGQTVQPVQITLGSDFPAPKSGGANVAGTNKTNSSRSSSATGRSGGGAKNISTSARSSASKPSKPDGRKS